MDACLLRKREGAGITRHAPHGCRFNHNLRLLGVLGKRGPPPIRLRGVSGRRMAFGGMTGSVRFINRPFPFCNVGRPRRLIGGANCDVPASVKRSSFRRAFHRFPAQVTKFLAHTNINALRQSTRDADGFVAKPSPIRVQSVFGAPIYPVLTSWDFRKNTD